MDLAKIFGSRRKQAFQVALTACVVAAAAAGCTSGSNATTSKPSSKGGHSGGTIVWAKPADVTSTDPTTDSGGAATDWEIYAETYSTLVGVDSSGKVVPELATRWSQTSPTSYLFTLRSGVKFSNGRLMTPSDVSGTLNRLADPKTASYWQSQLGIASASLVGTDQVKVTLAQANTAFLPALSGAMASILPMKEFDAKTFNPAKKILGTGPYEVESHVQGVSWTLKRNPYYWGTPAKADTIDIKILTDDSARLAALRGGSAQVATFANPDAVNQLAGTSNVKTVQQENNSYYIMDVNALSSLFTNAKLRTALALAVNRTQIASIATGGVGKPSAAIPPGFNVCDAATVPNGKTDVSKATALVAAAGATGKTISILVPSTPASEASVAQVLQQQIRAIGFKVTITVMDIASLAKKVFVPKASFDLAVLYTTAYSDPAMVLGNYLPQGYNAGFQAADSQLKTFVDSAKSLPNGTARTTALTNACSLIAQDANVVPLITFPTVVAYRSDRIDASILPVQMNDVPLSNLADFSVK